MTLIRWSILILFVVAYFGIAHVLTNRAMRHLKGPKPSIWLETPIVDSSLFTHEGKQHLRTLHMFYLLGGAFIVAVGFLLNTFF